MPTFRMLPPNAVGQQTILTNGRTHSSTPGNAIDVADLDAQVLIANGWIQVGELSGPTSARPSPLLNGSPPYLAVAGFHFFDTTLSKIVVFDGLAWRDPMTGTSV